MKTPFLLFGLATACAAAPAEPQYPLCDHAGAPACGNIGQLGRGAPANAPSPTAATVMQALHVAAEMPVRLVPIDSALPPGVLRAPAKPGLAIATRVLVGASQEVLRVGLTGQPLLDRNEEVVCGNVMTKGGSRRQCHTPAGKFVSSSVADDEEP